MIRAIGLGLALSAGLSGGSAIAMSNQGSSTVRCSVQRAEKLPSGLSAESVCSAIRTAVDPAIQQAGLPAASVTVSVSVDSDRKIAGAATVNGHVLPEHHIGISDRPLNARAVSMLAAAIAAEITSAKK